MALSTGVLGCLERGLETLEPGDTMNRSGRQGRNSHPDAWCIAGITSCSRRSNSARRLHYLRCVTRHCHCHWTGYFHWRPHWYRLCRWTQWTHCQRRCWYWLV